MGVTPAGSAASAPAGQSSLGPLHCPFLIGGRGGQEGRGTLGECEVGTLGPRGGCLEYREQHRSEKSSGGGGGAADWMPRLTGKLGLALVHAFSSFVPCFHEWRVRSEYLVDSGHLHPQAVCPHPGHQPSSMGSWPFINPALASTPDLLGRALEGVQTPVGRVPFIAHAGTDSLPALPFHPVSLPKSQGQGGVSTLYLNFSPG